MGQLESSPLPPLVEDSEESLAVALRRQGHRVTRPRLVVWQVLGEADQHLTVEAVTARVHRVDPSINIASVYRTLRLFQDLGVARVSRLGDDETSWWERAHPDEHIHLVCQVCGDVDHHAGSLVGAMTEHLGHHHDFEVESVEVVVRGRCSGCLSNESAMVHR